VANVLSYCKLLKVCTLNNEARSKDELNDDRNMYYVTCIDCYFKRVTVQHGFDIS